MSLALSTEPTLLKGHERAAWMNLLTACDCSGCADGWPHPDCSACGRPATVALEGCGHQMSLCGRCIQTVYEIRAAAGRNGARQEPLLCVWGTLPSPRPAPAPLRPPGWRAHRKKAGTRKAPAAEAVA